MTGQPRWQYDEMCHCGVDYGDAAQVAVYDERHQRLRNYEQRSREIVESLGLSRDDTVIDMGSGTGAFAVHAAKSCKRIWAVDVSKAMLDHCR